MKIGKFVALSITIDMSVSNPVQVKLSMIAAVVGSYSSTMKAE